MPKDEQFKERDYSNEVPGYEMDTIPSTVTKEAWSLKEHEEFINKLTHILGEGNVLSDAEARRFYAEDTFIDLKTFTNCTCARVRNI